MNYLPRHGADGAVNGFYIFVIDETERKQTEEALRNLNETLEERVASRTRQLAEANERLQNEMFERERAEDALRHAQKWKRSASSLAALPMTSTTCSPASSAVST